MVAKSAANKSSRRSVSGRRRFDRQPRSRTGCLTCRARHKRCDERAPTCYNCEVLNLKCEGYRSLLRWHDQSMQSVDIPETYYNSIRYINLSMDTFKEDIEDFMQHYNPFDVDYTAHLERPSVFRNWSDMAEHPQRDIDSSAWVHTPDLVMSSASSVIQQSEPDDYLSLAPTSGGSNISLPLDNYDDNSYDLKYYKNEPHSNSYLGSDLSSGGFTSMTTISPILYPFSEARMPSGDEGGMFHQSAPASMFHSTEPHGQFDFPLVLQTNN
ncbi:hypothetical protein V1511DRAFT_190148 [Dipodascopsis uninucleata]